MTDDAHREIARDVRDLRRGVAVNAIGYALKLAPWLLLILVTNAYGIERYGAYAIAQAVILFAVRIGALGLDKALLWWVPRQDAASKRHGIRSTLALAVALNVVLALVVFVLATPGVLRALHQPAEIAQPLRILALAMIPQVAMDVLSHASMGLRRIEAQVLVRDALVPIAFPLLAVAFFYGFDAVETGLPLAYLFASIAGMLAAGWIYVRLFSVFAPVPAGSERLPRGLVRYAIPMWLSEIANSLLQRLDIFLLEALTGDLALVGAYNIARRFSDSIRTIRRSFDAIVVAIASEIGLTGDRKRLTAGFSYATFLVTLTQLPVFAIVFAFIDELTPLFGHGFEAATVPVVILSVTWLVNGLCSMAGLVVTAYGYSRLTLFNTVLAIVVLAIACVLLIPPWSIVGAATAVGIAYTVQAIHQLLQMRAVTGGWNYDRTVLRPLALGAIAGTTMAALWIGLRTLAPDLPALAVEIVACGGFVIVYALGVVRMARQGLLSRASAGRRSEADDGDPRTETAEV